jgi:predicted RNase H-like nuclease (RuvC/YqgF family)
LWRLTKTANTFTFITEMPKMTPALVTIPDLDIIDQSPLVKKERIPVTEEVSPFLSSIEDKDNVVDSDDDDDDDDDDNSAIKSYKEMLQKANKDNLELKKENNSLGETKLSQLEQISKLKKDLQKEKSQKSNLAKEIEELKKNQQENSQTFLAEKQVEIDCLKEKLDGIKNQARNNMSQMCQFFPDLLVDNFPPETKLVNTNEAYTLPNITSNLS